MNQDKFLLVLDDICSQLHKLTSSKGREYTAGGNQFANFEEIAAMVGITREQTLMVNLEKHLRSIRGHINPNNNIQLSEPINSRILDAILFLILLYAMYRDNGEIV